MIQTSDWQTPTVVYAKKPGIEPIPGYVLIEPLGRGGFGEVWKCEAPGGLHKAVKFVAGSSDTSTNTDAQLRQEYEAFQQVKTIRHPYLLCIERVEIVGNELVMVMGLADRQLGDRFHECQNMGLPGIPRDELLGYLGEAAEALDVISTQYGLQHLDVKPANLFLTSGHVQVGDYGLVTKLDRVTGSGTNRGLTPKYAPPEVLKGQVHTRSDQYSLALVYQELLTGTFPYSARTPQQIMIQHVSAAPDLSSLSERDRGPVAIALAKKPEERFASCREFIKALAKVPVIAHKLSLITTGQKNATGNGDPSGKPSASVPQPQDRQILSSPTRGPAGADELTQRNSRTVSPPASVAGLRLVGIDRNLVRPAVETPPPVPVRPPASSVQSISQSQSDQHLSNAVGIRLQQILSVLPVGWLRGREAPEPDLPPGDMVRALLSAAGTGAATVPELKPVAKLQEGTWGCRFLTTIDPRIAKVKLDLLWEQGGLTMDARENNQIIFRQTAPLPESTGLFGFRGNGKKPISSGLEVIVELPEPGTNVGIVSAHGRLFGEPSQEFAQRSKDVIVGLLEDVQRQLNNFKDRRKHPRIQANFPIILYPLHDDGRVESPLSGQCQNISAGGLALRMTAQPLTKYAYIAFEGVRGTTGLALLFQITRTDRDKGNIVVSGKYRLDFCPKPPG